MNVSIGKGTLPLTKLNLEVFILFPLYYSLQYKFVCVNYIKKYIGFHISPSVHCHLPQQLPTILSAPSFVPALSSPAFTPAISSQYLSYVCTLAPLDVIASGMSTPRICDRFAIEIGRLQGVVSPCPPRPRIGLTTGVRFTTFSLGEV